MLSTVSKSALSVMLKKLGYLLYLFKSVSLLLLTLDLSMFSNNCLSTFSIFSLIKISVKVSKYIHLTTVSLVTFLCLIL